MKSRTLNMRLTQEEYDFLESFEGKAKAKVLRKALQDYMTKTKIFRAKKERARKFQAQQNKRKYYEKYGRG